jgi:hypothetical protein
MMGDLTPARGFRHAPMDRAPANAANRNAIIKTCDPLDPPWTPCR